LAIPISTPMRPIRSGCCARAASGNAAPRERVLFFDFDFSKRAAHPTSKTQLKARRCCLKRHE